MMLCHTGHCTTRVSKHLSIATDHLLSIKSVAASNVAGQANAARRPLKTVLIAPCFINSIASPASTMTVIVTRCSKTV